LAASLYLIISLNIFSKCTIVGRFVCQPGGELSLDENVSRAAAAQLIGKILSHAININLLAADGKPALASASALPIAIDQTNVGECHGIYVAIVGPKPGNWVVCFLLFSTAKKK